MQGNIEKVMLATETASKTKISSGDEVAGQPGPVMTESLLVFDVALQRKDSNELGLNIYENISGQGVYVRGISHGTTAFREGSIVPGDKILEINGTDVSQRSQREVTDLLRSAEGRIQLRIGRQRRFDSSDAKTRSPIATLLANIERESMKLEQSYLFQRGDREYDSNINDCFVEIEKKSSHLGIKIAGGANSHLGNVPVFIAMVEPNSPASKKLKIGDKILSINGQSTENKSHEEIVWMIKVASPDSILLMKVRRGEDDVVKLIKYLTDVSAAVNRMISTSLNFAETDESSHSTGVEDDSSDSSSVKSFTSLTKSDVDRRTEIMLDQGNEGLGFSVVGGAGSVHGDLPIFVKSVYGSGAAATEGRLRRGDRIIAVNGESLDGCTHEEAVTILKKWKGRVMLSVIPT